MAFRKSKMTVAEIIESPPHAVLGSAVQVTVANADWQLNQFGDGTWQTDAWHFYNNTPELHNTADYIGAACSMVRLYVSEIDEYGQPQGEVGAPGTGKDGRETDNSDIAIGALSSRLFGGPGAKAEILRALGVSLTVAGETYLIGQQKGRGKEKWYTVGPNEIRKINEETVSIAVGNGRYEELNVSSNMVVRVWTPHPNLMFRADSPTRGVLIPLRQQQELVRFLSSQLVSRLASASLLPVPANVQFPETDKHAGGWEGLLQQLYEAITSNLQGAGTAAMIAPILMPMEPEALAAMANIDPIVFESVLSSQAIDLRKELRETIAVGLNVPMEITLSSSDRGNHWSIWWANEEFIIKTIAPMMGRICDALTTSYLTPALEKMGKDPSRYMFWYDTAPLSNSANRLTDAKDLNVLGVVSDAAVRTAGAFHESDAMSKEEKDQRYLRELVLRDPTLFQLESVRKELGIDIEDFLPEVTVGEDLNAPGPAAPPRPGRVMSPPAVGAMPDAQASDSELIASLTARPSAILVAADAIVRRGLELAGKRLLTNSTRGMWSDVPAYKIHTKVKVASEIHAGTLLASAWDHVPEVFEGLGVDPNTMTRELDRYAKGLLSSSLEHNRTLLAGFLDSAGLR